MARHQVQRSCEGGSGGPTPAPSVGIFTPEARQLCLRLVDFMSHFDVFGGDEPRRTMPRIMPMVLRLSEALRLHLVSSDPGANGIWIKWLSDFAALLATRNHHIKQRAARLSI